MAILGSLSGMQLRTHRLRRANPLGQLKEAWVVTGTQLEEPGCQAEVGGPHPQDEEGRNGGLDTSGQADPTTS